MRNIRMALRSLRKDRSYTVTNLVGLTIGITGCLLILSFVRYELSFDRFHKKKDRIYRVNYDVLMGGEQIISPSVPLFVGPTLKRKFPEIEEVTRFVPEWSARTIRHGNVLFDEKGFAYADSNFFKILDFKPVEGNLHTALNGPNTLVITRSMAAKYFGKTDPLGQVLVFNNKKDYVVKAVIENVPANSHFSFNFLTSLYSIPGIDSLETKEIWSNPNYTTFLLLKPGASVAALSKKMEAWINPPEEAGAAASQNVTHLRLEPLTAVHFDTRVFNFKSLLNLTDFKYVKIFSTIALLILLIAGANYVNLSTAKASGRAREVGIRKTVGASLRQLFAQFLTESFLLVFLSVLLSGMAVYALLPFLNDLLGESIPFYGFDGPFLAAVAGGAILLALLAGFYPSLVLSRFRPVETLKGAFTKSGGGGVSVRKSLVVLQFTISVALILGTLIVRRQLDFMQTQKLGLDKDHVLIIHGNADIDRKLDAFSNDIRQISGVQEVARTWRSPFESVVGNGFSIKSHPTSGDDWHVVAGMAGDQHYLSAMGIPLLAGRNFDPSRINGDSTVNEFIVNEAFLRHYRLKPKQALGKEVILGLAGHGAIVGVMKDFHFSSMHDKIEPVVLFNNPGYFFSVAVRMGPGKIAPRLAKMAEVWRRFSPMRPFSYAFLDEEYDALYRSEQRLGSLMSLFCGVAILVTCLGLLGLMAFMVAQRTREIGIRKVIGASIVQITALLSKDFLRLVAIAIVIAMPLAWYGMHRWLQDFAYRVQIGWYIFGITALAAMLIAAITVGFQAMKAATANPVKSLRTD